MDMFLYLNKNTYMHHLDSRTKMLVMVVTFILALMFDRISFLLALLAGVLAYGASGGTLGNLSRIKIVLTMLALFSAAIWSITGGGPTRIAGPITLEGLLYGIAMAIKLDMMIIAGMIFLSATKIEELSLGLQKLKLPYRAAFAFSTAIRLVPMIVGTTYVIIQAQQSRGLDLDSGGPLTKLKKYVPLLIPVFVSVIRGTNVFAMALESKGFGYSAVRSSYLQSRFTPVDYLVATVVLLLLAGSLYMKGAAGW